MHFSRLRLTGFKSFVDPTDLVIAEGLTGIVGPNGCGKSNLLEAMRWVMGENRPSTMRGAGMEDVIFAGAASRPARHFAEVTLHIDNSRRLAPAGFNDSDTLEVVRRITRDAGSAYKVNAKEVRARDVQMLFADASTGAHSPALVSQGQISELIRARPKARRRLLEEAAGISGLYQRRHEAELKLNAAEANLARTDDLIDQLATQLAQLERQARQAARYRVIGQDLRRAEAMLLLRRWADAAAGDSAAAAGLREQRATVATAESATRAAAQARQAAEAALPARREEETIAGAVLQRLLVQQEALDDEETRARSAIDTLTARLDQLSRDLEREAGLNRDADESMARLRSEAADLAAAAEGYGERLAEAARKADESAALLASREAGFSRQTEELAQLRAQHHAARRRVEDSERMAEKSETEAGAARRRLAEAREAQSHATAELERLRLDASQAQRRAEAAEAVLAGAEAERAALQTREGEARASRSTAEGERDALAAEVAALARLLDRDGAGAGQILDRLRVEPGFEKALGAALSEDLQAPEAASARESGWVTLAPYEQVQPLPDGAVPLAAHVEAPAVLTRRLAQVGITDADAGARLHGQLLPGQRLVSREGDLWRWDGFCTRAGDAPSAAAARLEQRNRLESLRATLEAVETRLTEAAEAHAALAGSLSRAAAAEQEARDARRRADHALSEASRALSRAEAESNLTAGRVESLELALSRHEEALTAARADLRDAQHALAALGDPQASEARVEEQRIALEAARITMMTHRSAHDELRRDGEARERRSAAVARDLESWQSRHATADRRIAELDQRRTEAEAALAAAAGAPDEIAARRQALAGEVDRARARADAARETLVAAEAAVQEALAFERDRERAASEAREERARGETRAEAARQALDEAVNRIDSERSMTPERLRQELSVETGELPGMDALEAEVQRFRRQREALGAVNLRAEEDAAGVREEHDGLLREKGDLEEAIGTLRSAVSSLNREGRERLLGAFEQVNRNFAMLFQHLFGGGEANLVMVESDDPLEAGLEIMCQPPGKRLSTLSLLSGGEQTLTAAALIFAVFLVNPAPICVLDEVDAPLDDANVTRFCDLLDEMCARTATRFLIITHHAVTMSRMDRLFGVTMGEKGVSQLVSVDLKKAEALVA
ncbi:chromosome segregation protein SMC [Pontibaca methylaminivorans]|uniref:chromosome segregation protein SMC n=1 Tax=Pontibaca methylaminivorans TaxID=515897 RepID=UPI002FDB5B7E